MSRRPILLAAATALAACAAEVDSTPPVAPEPFAFNTPNVCDEPATPVSAPFLAVTATPVALDPADPERRDLDRLVYRGGFHITSPEARFGGLSGLKVIPSGPTTFLVAPTDQGDLFAINFGVDEAGEFGAIGPGATLSMLLGPAGDPLDDKAAADAEGVAWRGSTLHVSFERNHRVSAFDLECAASARERTQLAFGGFQGVDGVGDNAGVEGLALSLDGQFILGLEAPLPDGAGPIAIVRPGEPAVFDQALPAMDDDLRITGLDYVIEDGVEVLYAVRRAWDPVRGSRVAITRTLLLRTDDERLFVGPTETLARLASPLTVDNFEGIAVAALKNGQTSIFLVSDDNFSKDQRTLILSFTYDRGAGATPAPAR